MSARKLRASGKPLARLEGWFIVLTTSSAHVVGIVFGHVKLLDGQLAITSDLREIHIVSSGEICAETLNTLYVLGEAGRGALPKCYRELADELFGHEWHSLEETAGPLSWELGEEGDG